MPHARHTFQFEVYGTPEQRRSQKKKEPVTAPWVSSCWFMNSNRHHFPPLFFFSAGWEKKFCSGHIYSAAALQRDTQWKGEDGILSAGSRPMVPVISELEIHRASSNRPRPWSSGHRTTAWARRVHPPLDMGRVGVKKKRKHGTNYM